MMILPVIPGFPMKPQEGEPCNGCGHCCAMELCHAGKEVHGDDHPAPCPSLHNDGGRFWCGLAKHSEAIGMGAIFSTLMGFGYGCDATP